MTFTLLSSCMIVLAALNGQQDTPARSWTGGLDATTWSLIALVGQSLIAAAFVYQLIGTLRRLEYGLPRVVLYLCIFIAAVFAAKAFYEHDLTLALGEISILAAGFVGIAKSGRRPMVPVLPTVAPDSAERKITDSGSRIGKGPEAVKR